MLSDPTTTIRAFIDAINAGDVGAITRLMAPDHLFVDSGGSSIKGREEMRKAWIAYFYLVPDYRIIVSQMLPRGDAVGVFGIAHGTYAAGQPLHERNRWQMPAAWLGVVHDGLVAEWHVYADNEPVREIMLREQGP